ncbi:bactofilin family protein [Cohnella yongneupensis]|uniref:Polymer-forming cytoskeletal protein n=1 Tax=Cohnella yongneupensis TaxID=425006 RepID=A0ABW0R6I1_9BACL
MFKNGKKQKIDPNSTDTLIGEGSSFEGKIKSEAGLRVEGQIVGDIDCAGDVTVGENGIAKSHIKARNVIIAGQVTGNVSAAGKLTIKASGQLHGNLSALELSIESGGVFHGLSKMDVKDAAAPVAEENSAIREPEAPKLAVAPVDDTAAVLKTW